MSDEAMAPQDNPHIGRVQFILLDLGANGVAIIDCWSKVMSDDQ